ncbi:hypothetical protein H0H87_001013 [Tephrocybe sp. NHM501043]|nr:hypothetical protein H0H87_001013 [Tephrocybe sp. NHM501043]
MSEDMTSSWRYISAASSRVSSIGRGYIKSARFKPSAWPGTVLEAQAQEGSPKGWRSWAGQKLRLRRGTVDGTTKSGNDTLNLFPGWAVRRYRKSANSEIQDAFEIEVFVSGFAINHRPLENASRSQRAFIRLAKGFASLPKLTADAIEPEPVLRLSPSTEALLQQKILPPRPTEITDDYVFDALERQLQRAKTESSDSTNSEPSSDSESPEPSEVAFESSIPTPTPARSSLPSDALRKLHDNLESRLQPFWSSVLASRTVRIYLFGSPHHYRSPADSESDDERDEVSNPLGAQDIITAADGSFQARFVVKWEDLCQHPGALHIAFGDKLEEHDVLIAAQIQPAIPSPSASTSNLNAVSAQDTPISPIKMMRIPITHSPIRVISDIDDTVKLSNIISGARAVFQNVFVKDLKENIIPGMGEWYTSMWKRGVRFHYVSNGPFELLPIVNEFLQISQLPPGSIRLKSYAGRSIFNGLLSAPAMRKRAGVVDVLDSFPDSRFFLIGDTGEQDMELYAELARERPHQVLAVLVRDVETGEPIDDPTGWTSLGATENTPRPRSRRTLSTLLSSNKTTPTTSPGSRTGVDYFTSTPLVAEPESTKSFPGPASTAPPPSAYNNSQQNNHNNAAPASVLSKSSTMSSVNSSTSKMPEGEKRRYALQARVYLARTQMPGHVPLRVFRNANECVEVEDVLGRELEHADQVE